MGVIEERKVGRCWACGYLLRGLGQEARRCPECGREFDPADRSTMNFGREMGRLGRFMLTPVSWSLVITGVVACVLVLSVSRWPVGDTSRWFVDLPYYFTHVRWRERLREVGWEGAVYMGAVVLWMLVLCAWWGGTALRWLAIWRYRPPAFQRGREVRQHWVLSAVFVATVVGVGIGWAYRLGRLWAAKERDLDNRGVTGSARSAIGSMGQFLSQEPAKLIPMVRTAARHGRSPGDRLYAVKVMVEGNAPNSVDWVAEAEVSEKDMGNRAVLLRLMGMYRKEEAVGEVLERRLGDPVQKIRVAAADGLGFLHGVAYQTHMGWNPDGVRTESDPPIHVGRLIERVRYWGSSQGTFEEWAERRRIEMPEGRRKKLMAMMLGEVTLEEREAAARALLACPDPGHKLRVAEWGVWVAKGGYIAAARAKGAMPAFVHEAGDSAGSIAKKRLQPLMDIDKPVIHLTASGAMAVDVEVRMRLGRPWFVYPMPDDYSVKAGTTGSGRAREDDELLVGLDPEGLGALGGKPLRQGYPWLKPANPVLTGDYLSEVGFRWQSLIVSPSKLSWMKEPAVDPKGPAGWWARLRDVESSWVSSRGESERFLYYDGPTMVQLPVTLKAERTGVRAYPPMGGMAMPAYGIFPSHVPPARDGLYLRVDGGKVTESHGLKVPMPIWDHDGKLVPVRVMPAGEAKDWFVQKIRETGLTESEAGGMMASWEKEWFERDGSRVLIFLFREDYDELCPIRVRPKPTELVRVGVVWVEF